MLRGAWFWLRAAAQHLLLVAALALGTSAFGLPAQPVGPPQGLGVTTLPSDTAHKLTAAEQDLAAQALFQRFPASIGDLMSTTGRSVVQIDLHHGGGQVTWVALQRPMGTRISAFLELPYALLDGASLYWRDAEGQLREQRAGDQVLMSSWPVAGRYPTFDLATSNPPDGRWLLALRHQVATGIPMRLTDAAQMSANRQSQGLLLGGAIGMFLLVIVLCGIQFAASRDLAYGWYGLHAGVMLLLQLALMGLLGQYLLGQWPMLNDRAAAALSSIAITTLAMLSMELARGVNTIRADRWIRPVLLAVVISGLGLAALQFVGDPAQSKFLVSLVQPVQFALLATVLIWAARGGDRVIRWVLIGFLPPLIGAAFPLLTNAGLIDVGFLSLYGVQLGVLVEIPLLYFALTLRHRERREQAVRAQALNRNDPTTGLLIRSVFTERVQACAARARRQRHASWLVGVEVANLSRIEEAFDPLVANQALVVAAGAVLKVAREVDDTSRLTHNVLALLVEGPMAESAVQSLGVEMVAAGLRSNPALPPGVRLQLRVVAMPLGPAGMAEGEALVQALLEATAANRGKRAVRVLPAMPEAADLAPVKAEVDRGVAATA